MGRVVIQWAWRRKGAFVLCAALCLSLPGHTFAWGKNGHRLVVNKAIDTLPQDIRPFFESNLPLLSQHVTDPLDAIAKSPAERHNHFILLDKYGRFPFEALPRNYKAAVTKFGKPKLDANGLLPWQIGVYSEKLTEAMKASKWDEARLHAAILANYVAEAHDPFNTTDNFDGRLSAQAGINERFGTTLIDRYSSFFPMRPNGAIFINDPTDRAFEACLSSHSWLETILLADRNARRGENSFTDEYYDRFYNQAAAILIRQLSDAATDVGSYWLTAWVNAGRPQLPH
ncbi:MAG: hypothetical protein DMG49_17215 [Acidobacteria bacterium]|nr:MAG: hypothetical protein DMG49_17215 [Acidobacteriota bacterium]